MSEKAKSWKAGPESKRADNAKSAVLEKREERMGRRRMGIFEATPEEIGVLLNEFQPAAILQSENLAACLHHVIIFDKIIKFQQSMQVEDMLSKTKGVDPMAAARFLNQTEGLLPRLFFLLENVPACQIYCSNLFANLACCLEAERWIIGMFSAGMVASFGRFLSSNTPGAVVEGVLACIGNVCSENAVYRNALFPALNEAVLKLAPPMVSEVSFVNYCMLRRMPLPPPETVAAWWPFMIQVLSILDPDLVAETAYPVRCVALALRQMAKSEPAYRELIISNPLLITPLVNISVSEWAHMLVRIAAADCLSHLTGSPHAPVELIPVFGQLLMCKEADIRISACVGLLGFSKNPAVLSIGRNLLAQIQQGSNAVRIAALETLNTIAIHLHDTTLLEGWLQAGLVPGLYANFGAVGRDEQSQLKCVKALNHLFSNPVHGKRAVAEFEELGGEDALHKVFCTVSTPILADATERILDRYFGAASEF
jgi:hypothetical protein